MAKGLKHGAGGASPLNFRVLGGTTQPANLRENDIWVNTDVAVSGWDFSATEPQRRSSNKNLIVHPYDHAKQTINGITFTPYTGGTIGASGTATAQATFYLNDKNPLVLPAGTYTFSGAIDGGGADTWIVALKYSYDNFENISYSSTGTHKTITFDKPVKVVMYLQVRSGVTVSGNFRPQLEKGATVTAFLKGDATGQVWISTGSSSPAQFNSLKKNNITLCPLSAKQYVGGAWANKTAKSYQNGAWVDWWNPFYIFKSGEGAIAPLKHYTAGGVNATHTNSSIVHKRTGSAIRAVTVTQTAVALSGYSKLCARAKCTYANTEHVPVLGLLSTAANNDQARPDIASVGVVANSAETVYSVPIPSGVSTAYIGYCGGSDIEIYDIWLE